MNAEKLEDWELEMWDEELCCDLSQSSGVGSNAKRALVGAGARALFYPTLLYNVVRNKIQPEFHWWDRVDEFILLGAVPFAADVPRLKKLGVGGVVTLNESYESLVPTLLYHAHSIDHLVIPTRDYLFAPSLNDTRRAVDFIYSNASLGRTTYVHCKAGRGRSTTIVLCYLVEHKQMTPDAAYNYVKSIRPRVVLASAQWKAVQDYYLQKVKKTKSSGCINNRVRKSPFFSSKQYAAAFDDDSIDIVTESDLDGYKSYGTSCDSIIMVTQSELDGYDSSCNSSTVTQILLPCFRVKLLLPGTNTLGFGTMQGRRQQGRSSEAQWLKSRFFERWMPIESVLHLNSHQWMLRVPLEQIMMFHGKSLMSSYGISRV